MELANKNLVVMYLREYLFLIDFKLIISNLYKNSNTQLLICLLVYR